MHEALQVTKCGDSCSKLETGYSIRYEKTPTSFTKQESNVPSNGSSFNAEPNTHKHTTVKSHKIR